MTTTDAGGVTRVMGAGWRRKRQPGLTAWLFALPAVAVYATFLVWPTMKSLWLSLTSWDGLSPTKTFVGLQNYRDMFSDPVMRTVVHNTLLWAAVTITVPMVLGLLLAVFLNGSIKAKPFLRTLFYTPAVLPLIAIASMWGWLYDPSKGAINVALKAVGLGDLAQPWLGQDSTALWAAMIPAIWVRTGFPMLLYLAALQTIPKDLYEASTVDGASPLQQFWHITMPSLKPAHYVVLALSLIESFKVFDIIYAMTYGGPGSSTQVFGTYMYFNVFQYQKAGYGTAIAVVITLVALVAGLPYVRSQTKED
jgi:raffinose/stachyose/melibiose transport system permease protein